MVAQPAIIKVHRPDGTVEEIETIGEVVYVPQYIKHHAPGTKDYREKAWTKIEVFVAGVLVNTAVPNPDDGNFARIETLPVIHDGRPGVDPED